MPRPDIASYHPDVNTYEVREKSSGELLRAPKRAHASRTVACVRRGRRVAVLSVMSSCSLELNRK